MPPGGREGGPAPSANPHIMSRALKRISITLTVEDCAHFLANRDLRMGIVVPKGELQDVLTPAYRYKGLFIKGTFADPQELIQLRNGIADADGSAACSAEACTNAHCARPGKVPFGERSYKHNHARRGKLWAPRQQRR